MSADNKDRINGQVQTLSDLKYDPLLHIVLFQPEIPPNTGAVGRTCVALQAKLWLVKPLGFQLNEKTLRRAGLDYWQHLEWEVADHWDDLAVRLKAQHTIELAGPRTWLFSRFAERSYTDVGFEQPDVFVFGCETSGLPRPIVESFEPSQLLQIPTHEHVRSINLSCAVAVAGFEAQRQIKR